MEGGPAGVTGALQGMAELQQVDLRLLGTASSADANGSAAEVSVAAALAALNTVEPRIVRKLACGKTVAMMLLGKPRSRVCSVQASPRADTGHGRNRGAVHVGGWHVHTDAGDGLEGCSD